MAGFLYTFFTMATATIGLFMAFTVPTQPEPTFPPATQPAPSIVKTTPLPPITEKVLGATASPTLANVTGNEPADKENTTSIEPVTPAESTETQPVVKPIVTETQSKAISPEADYEKELATKIIKLTNDFRKDRGLEPLTENFLLNKTAKQHSRYLLSLGQLTHTGANGCDMTCRFNEINHSFLTWGENIASIEDPNTYSVDDLANEFLDLWLKSSQHRANILSNDYTFTGIATSMKNNELYIAVEFAAS